MKKIYFVFILLAVLFALSCTNGSTTPATIIETSSIDFNIPEVSVGAAQIGSTAISVVNGAVSGDVTISAATSASTAISVSSLENYITADLQNSNLQDVVGVDAYNSTASVVEITNDSGYAVESARCTITLKAKSGYAFENGSLSFSIICNLVANTGDSFTP